MVMENTPYKSLEPDEQATLALILAEINATGSSEILEGLVDMEYEHPLPDAETFLLDPYYMGETGRSIFPKLMDDLIDIIDGGPYYEIHLTGGIGWGKCCANQYISTDKGIMLLSEMVGRTDLYVNGMKDGKVVKVKVKTSIYSGNHRKVLKIRLTNGRDIKVTSEHPIKTSEGYVEARNLKKGDFVCTSRKLSKLCERERPEKDVIFCAYTIADGGLTQSNVHFTNGTEEIASEFRDLFQGYSKNGWREEYSCNAYYFHARGPVARDKMKEWGLWGKYSKEKRLPTWVFDLPSSQVGLFINRFWGCDGSIRENALECILASEYLIDDLMDLLRMEGVYSRKYYKKAKCGDKYFDAWRLRVSGKPNIEKFLNLTGNIIGKDRGCQELRNYVDNIKTNTNTDISPINYEKMKELRKLVGCISREDWGEWKIPKNQFMGMEKARKMLNYFGVEDTWWREVTSEDVYWEKVKLVETGEKEDVYDLEVPETKNFITTNGVVVHNSVLSEFIMARMVAECLAHRDPASAFGLMPGSTITFVNISVSETQARRVMFSGLAQKVKRSPFFQEFGRPDPRIVSELRFPKDILVSPLSSTDNSVLGLDIWGAVMDEGNFMSVVEKSTAKHRAGKRYDQAESIYNAMMARMKSRFMSMGSIPGKIILSSSKTFPDTFMERRMRDVKATGEKGVKILDYSTWDTKPSGTYSGVTFPIEVGDISNMSQIVDDIQVDSAFGKVIDVPVEFKPEFEKDIDQAIRDLAGIATATINPYLKDFRKITLAIDDREHPFSSLSTNLQDNGHFIDDLLVQDHERLGKSPILNPEAPRWVHIDPSITGDATGFCMGHVGGLVEVSRRDSDTERWITDESPLFVVDVALRIVPPSMGEIDFVKVRELVYTLKDYGFDIRGVSLDSYQSRETMQHYRKRGYQAELISVEKEGAYKLLKDAFYEKRMMIYSYKPLLEELRRLEYDRKSGKIDHPVGGEKDVSDALCGVIVGLSRYMVSKKKPGYAVRIF